MKTKVCLAILVFLSPYVLSAQFSKLELIASQKKSEVPDYTMSLGTFDQMTRSLAASFSIDPVVFFDPEQKMEEVKGSPFFVPKEWVSGTIEFKDKLFSSDKMNYCVLMQQIWVKENNDIMALTDVRTVNKIVLNNKFTFVLKIFEKKTTLFELLVDALDVALLKQYEAKLVGPSSKSSYGSVEGAHVEINSSWYYEKAGVEPVRIPKSREALVQLFPDHQEELLNFAKKNKTNPRTEKDLMALFTHYRSLLD